MQSASDEGGPGVIRLAICTIGPPIADFMPKVERAQSVVTPLHVIFAVDFCHTLPKSQMSPFAQTFRREQFLVLLETPRKWRVALTHRWLDFAL